MIAYIVAGVILGIFSLGILFRITGVGGEIPLIVLFLMAFVGGVVGHLVFNLVY